MAVPRKDIREVMKIRPPGSMTTEKKAAKEAIDSMLKVSEVGGRLMVTPTKFTLTLPAMTAGELARYFASLDSEIKIVKTICDGDPVRIT